MKVLRSVRRLGRILALIWRASPSQSTVVAVLSVAAGLLPMGAIWSTKLLVDQVTHQAEVNAPGLLAAIAIYVGLQATSQVIGPVLATTQVGLGELVNHFIALSVMAKTASIPDVTPYDEPRFHDQLRLILNEASYRSANLLGAAVQFARTIVSIGSVAYLVWRYNPLLTVLLLLAFLPRGALAERFKREIVKMTTWQAPEVRRMQYYQSVVMSEAYAKDVRLYGLFDYFTGKFRKAFRDHFRMVHSLRVRQSFWSAAVTLVSTGALTVGVVWTAYRALGSQLSVGDVVLFLQSAGVLAGSVEAIVVSMGSIMEALLFAETMFDFLDAKQGIELPPKERAVAVPSPVVSGIEFRNVSFRYPDGPEVLQGVSFSIRAGEFVAVVGPNGAGKSTVVKLLCRLYDPTEGQILVDGLDLKMLDLQQWRSQLATVFQDVARYYLSVRDNVGIGNVSQILSDLEIAAALEEAGAAGVVAQLADGLEQQLGRQFDGGVDLSGGEWQKLSLARAYLRDAQIVILDEPSSALDAHAEHDLQERFRDLSAEKTTLVISHRLSMARAADRILVIDKGRVVEFGTHDQLLALNGLYAQMFHTQANGYAVPV